ncbi:polysaccharide deacetylase family protein [Pseudogulbenkiania sp. MAI-1]|uniref:polysaccharide deacetylase family protein n=1 Tax=Pseudogulbenkiania sp. MAI-1 TaxID=990370 RepID=UPI00045EA093|nr:polysaccharide deacetylase family protein [Pseudogulbenkiania sp. MAI-1]
MATDDAFAPLRRELDRWQEAGRPATFWWRDDDAVADSAALQRLLALADAHGAPLWLAVIPARLEESLPAALEDRAAIGVLQHGIAHQDHAAPGERQCELSATWQWEPLRAALQAGRERLAAAFGPRFRPVLVPPWNRIHAGWTTRLPEAGLVGLSTLGPREPVPGLTVVNVHADLIDWHRRQYAGDAAVAAALARHLAARRQGEGQGGADPAEPTGLMSHHLVHDAALWDGCARLLAVLAEHPAAIWLEPETLWSTRGVSHPRR